MKVLTLKIRGRSEKKKECQDSVYIRRFGHKGFEVIVFALSDGASSASKSRIGSEFATRTFVKQVIKNMREQEITNNHDVESLLKKSYEDLKRTFKKNFYPNYRDYDATLVGGVLIASDNSKKMGFVSVGDSVLFLLKKYTDGSYKVVGKNQILKGEFIESTFVFNNLLGDYVYNIQVYEDFDVILLASDGFEGLLYKARKIDTDPSRKFHEIHKWETEELETLSTLVQHFEKSDRDDLEKSLEEIYKSDSFMKINDDDKSLIIIGGLTDDKSKGNLE